MNSVGFCEFTASGAVSGAQCWGDLGARADTGVYARAPPSNVVWESLSVGGGHSCGLQRLTDVDFTAVRCFGDNDAGQLNAPAGVVFADVAAGSAHSCGLAVEDGTAASWRLDGPSQVVQLLRHFAQRGAEAEGIPPIPPRVRPGSASDV